MNAKTMRVFWYGYALCIMALLGGCGSAGNFGSNTGTGADAGPWPTRTVTPTTAKPVDPSVKAPLMVSMSVSPSEGSAIRLGIERVELKYAGGWLTVATQKGISDLETAPLTFDAKRQTALLANTQVVKQKYTAVRVRLKSEVKDNAYIHDKAFPLTLEADTTTFADWTPDEKQSNLISIAINGTEITPDKDGMQLTTKAITVKTSAVAGGITGTIDPAMPNARVEAYWGKTKLCLGKATPAAQDGSFTITSLPPGSYRLEVRAAGYHPVEGLSSPITVEAKTVTIKTIKLATDSKGTQ